MSQQGIVLTETEYANGRKYWRVWVAGTIVGSVDSGTFGGYVVSGGRKVFKAREEAARHSVRANITRKLREISVLSSALESGEVR